MQTKPCSKCGKEKFISEFTPDKGQKSGFRPDCKICRLKISQKYYEKNKEKILEYTKGWYSKNKDKHINRILNNRIQNYDKYLIQTRKYRQTHKEEINNKRRISLKNNIDLRLLANLRTRIYQALKGNIKSKRTLELLGCTPKNFRNYIEAQFKVGMNWNNYGTGWNGKGMQEWHIDHIIPCANFNLKCPNEQKQCFSYKNLQPLWAKENYIKSDKDIYYAKH